jgi:hypothetical protein
MPPAVIECVVAPLAVVLALRHLVRTRGPVRGVLELLVLAAYGFVLEWAAMALFAAYRYGDVWTAAPAGVPVAVAFVWAAIIVCAMALASRAGARSPGRAAATAAAFAIALDLLMEPVASRRGLWTWTPAGHWLGVPVGNFVGWAVIVGSYAFGERRWAGERSLLVETGRRALLCVGAVGALIAVGALWRGTGAESLFDRGAGWIVWALLVLAPILLARVPAGEDGAGTGEALSVFAIVGGAFALEAGLSGDPVLWLVAAGSVASLAWTFRGFYLKSFLRLVRAESLGESASSS